MTEEKQEEPAPQSVQSLELETLRREAEDYKDKYLRLLAETENARKRLQKERQEISQFAIEGLCHQLLNPLDHLEGALKFTDQASEETRHWALGFKMILEQVREVLKNYNIHSFDSLNCPFDPHLHQAVEIVPSEEHPPGTIIQENVKGYKIGDRTLRPARVVVTALPKTEGEKENEQKEVE